MANSPIVILGTGLAGYSVARELRKHDQRTALVLVTRDDGAAYYKPDLSEALAGGETPDDLVQYTAVAMAEQLDATVRTHDQADVLDLAAHKLHLKGETLAYSKLVIAQGAGPKTLNLCGDAVDTIHTMGSLADYRVFRAHLATNAKVVILGAGLVGSELANDLIEAGHKVAIADPVSWPLAQLLPKAAGKAVKRELSRAGVEWHLGRAAVGVQHGHRGDLEVMLDNDRAIHADIVLSAVGLEPQTELAAEAGLTVDRGIQVDRTLTTSDPNVYALGDCAEIAGLWRPYVAPLVQCARALGRTLAEAPSEPASQVEYPVLPIIAKTHLCPVIVYPPVARPGEWRIEGEAPDIEARFVDGDGVMQGFALTGRASAKCCDYLKQVPALLV